MVITEIKKEELEKHAAFSNHKKVLKFTDEGAKLQGFIAIHNDNLGPAVGGTRVHSYISENAALDDVLRLSRTMTYKCALAGVKYGGGKAVIIGDPTQVKTKELLEQYAKVINSLNGHFFTGEDVGLNEEDVHLMLKSSEYFIGRPNQAVDPSPFAALSVFLSIKTIVELILNRKELKNITVAIKGVGKVGGELVRLLQNEGAKIIVADINREALSAIKQKFPDIEVVEPGRIHSLAVDVYAPCALSSEFTNDTMKEVRTKIICGGANSQLYDAGIGDWLYEHSIAFVPDYIANAGGLIDVVDELEEDGFNKERVMSRINQVGNTVRTIFSFSRDAKRPPHRVADMLAEDMFNGKTK